MLVTEPTYLLLIEVYRGAIEVYRSAFSERGGDWQASMCR